MKVVSDTSPICYLLLIRQVDLLPALFQQTCIPLAVRDELAHPDSPAVLRQWIASPPGWLEIRPAPPGADDLDRLHPGEREAIALAEELRADLVLLDEKKARLTASRRGLEVMGLLGILAQAAQLELISLVDTLERLRKTSFRADPRLLKEILDQHGRG